MSRKRDTYSSDPAPYYRGTPAQEAAKHLSNVARRFAQEKANANDVDAAIQLWREATYQVASASPPTGESR